MFGHNGKKTKPVSNMTVAELKAYLQMRGVTVNGYLKPALLEIAEAVEKMMLPIDLNNQCVNEENAEGREKYIINNMVIEQPLSYVVNDFTGLPPFGLYEIFNHLIYHPTEYDKQGLAAYKSLFDEGYVEYLLKLNTLADKRNAHICWEYSRLYYFPIMAKHLLRRSAP